MPDYQMTIDGETVRGLFQEDAGLAKLLERVLNQVLEAQVGAQLRAERYERTEERQGYRNGLRPRQLTTRVGRLTLRVPQVREGQSHPSSSPATNEVSKPSCSRSWRWWSMASPRAKSPPSPRSCVGRASPSRPSRRCAPGSTHWLPRGTSVPWASRTSPSSWPTRIAIGINAAGYREILGIQLGDSESEGSWSTFFGWLKRRGLAGVDLVVSDAHTGLVAAVQRHFQGCTWQRCQTHLASDVLEAVPKSLRQELHEHLRILFEAPDMATARLLLEQLLQIYTSRVPMANATLEAGFDDATAVLALPELYRRRLRTSNGMERLNEEVRRRERIIRIFPNRESAIRLLGAVLMERHEQWTMGHRYFEMASYWQWRHEQHQRDAALGTASVHTAQGRPVAA